MTSMSASRLPVGARAPAGWCSLYLCMTLGEPQRPGKGKKIDAGSDPRQSRVCSSEAKARTALLRGEVFVNFR